MGLISIKESAQRLELEKKDFGRELFINEFNNGSLAPAIVRLEDQDAVKDILEFENTPGIEIVQCGDEVQMLLGIRKMFERFVPMSRVAAPEEYQSMFTEYLQSKGISVTRGKDTTFDEDVISSLQTHGSVGYFPSGITNSGVLNVEKVRYFSEPLEREMLNASESLLVSEETHKVFTNSTVVAFGLSVGSEMAAAAFQKGITKFAFYDPGVIHPDLIGRLGVNYNRGWIGANKAQYMRRQILISFPYAEIEVHTEGLTKSNYMDAINEGRLTKSQLENGGRLFIFEETDQWEAKEFSRKASYALPVGYPWDHFMLGDIANRVIFCHEDESTRPFHEAVAHADPNGDPYGEALALNSPLKALVASVHGLTGFPQSLLTLLSEGKIGIHPGSDIAIVPQAGLATRLASAAISEALTLRASGEPVIFYTILDLEGLLHGDFQLRSEALEKEKIVQEDLNMKFFGVKEL